MKKLSEEHYVGVDDSEIKEGDWVFNEKSKEIYPITLVEEVVYYKKKVTHSTQPIEPNSLHRKYDFINIKPLSLSEVKELIGEVDVEKKADFDSKNHYVDQSDYWAVGIDSYKRGYNQALEDNKEKKYTEEDLRKIFIHGKQLGLTIAGSIRNGGDKPNQDMWFNESRESLQPKTEWEVEFVDGILKLKK